MDVVAVAACPECGVKLKIKGDHPEGKALKCPKCATKFVPVVPTKAKPKAVPAAEADEEERDDEQAENNGADDQADQDAGPDDSQRTKKKKKKKKKKKSAAEKSTGLVIGSIVVGGVLLLGLGIFAAITVAKKSGKGMTIANLVRYNAPEAAFQCIRPEGWTEETGGRVGFYWASWTNGKAYVKVRQNEMGAVHGDIAKLGSKGDEDEEFAPVMQLHKTKQEKYQEDFSGYKEEGPPQAIRPPMGDTRVSQFTGSSFSTGKVTGYRVTILGAITQIDVECRCAPKDWATLQPEFMKIIMSVAPGVRE